MIVFFFSNVQAQVRRPCARNQHLNRLALDGPAKPYYVALSRITASASQDKISLHNEDGSLFVIKPLVAYPNPFGSSITIDFELENTCKVSTELITLEGKTVYNNPAGTLVAGSYSLQIQTQQIAAGNYTLVLKYGNKVRSTKVIKF